MFCYLFYCRSFRSFATGQRQLLRIGGRSAMHPPLKHSLFARPTNRKKRVLIFKNHGAKIAPGHKSLAHVATPDRQTSQKIAPQGQKITPKSHICNANNQREPRCDFLEKTENENRDQMGADSSAPKSKSETESTDAASSLG